MPNLSSLEFEHKGSSYSIKLDFDDSAMVQDTIAFDVIAVREEDDLPELKLAARVEIHPLERSILIFVEEREVTRLSIFETSDSYLEELIDNIPQVFLVDPVIGCAIKAGVSSIVGRAVECGKSLEADEMWKNFKNYFGCMADKFVDISKKAVYRTFRCIFTGV